MEYWDGIYEWKEGSLKVGEKVSFFKLRRSMNKRGGVIFIILGKIEKREN